MSRTKSITSIQNEIDKITQSLTDLKAKEDALSSKLLALQKQKQEWETQQVMEAFRKSGKTMDELMTFLDV